MGTCARADDAAAVHERHSGARKLKSRRTGYPEESQGFTSGGGALSGGSAEGMADDDLSEIPCRGGGGKRALRVYLEVIEVHGQRIGRWAEPLCHSSCAAAWKHRSVFGPACKLPGNHLPVSQIK